MVSQWGMNDEVGSVGYQQADEQTFPAGQQQDYSERTAELIYKEARNLTTELEQRAEQLLTDHRDRLETPARTPLGREVLQADEIRHIAGTSGRSVEKGTAGSSARRAIE